MATRGPQISLERCLPLGFGRSKQLSQNKCFDLSTGASADSTQVVAELRRGPPTILLALGQVLTLPWWWQSLEVVPVPSFLHWGKC